MRPCITLAVLVTAVAACHDETAPSIFNAQGAWFSVSVQTGDYILKPTGAVFAPGTVSGRALLLPGKDVLGKHRSTATQNT